MYEPIPLHISGQWGLLFLSSRDLQSERTVQITRPDAQRITEQHDERQHRHSHYHLRTLDTSSSNYIILVFWVYQAPYGYPPLCFGVINAVKFK